nr:transcription factor Mnt-like isoform X1 [Ciona intestinalis]|eukprot:XP_009861486.1 transcription factor Mnt-like isoform X1 [Ciona intestinalis]
MSLQTLLEAVEYLETKNANSGTEKRDEKVKVNEPENAFSQTNVASFKDEKKSPATSNCYGSINSVTSQPPSMTSSSNPLFSQTLPLNLASYFDPNRKTMTSQPSNLYQHRNNIQPSSTVAPSPPKPTNPSNSNSDTSHRNNISYVVQNQPDLQWIASKHNNNFPGHAVIRSTNDKPPEGAIPLNSLLPSLVKTTEDEKVYCALQFKQKVTLTHNQLEKIRRAHLKECFEALKSHLPGLGIRRSSNLTILKAANRHIKIIVKKCRDNLTLKEKLKREIELKQKQLNVLMDELSQHRGREAVDKYLEEAIVVDERERTISTSSVHSSILDDDQKSTSTASEAEEQRASLVIAHEVPESKNNNSALTAANIETLQATYSMVKQRNEVSKVTISEPTKPHNAAINDRLFITNTDKVVMSATPSVATPQVQQHRGNFNRNHRKIYGQPSGRSATPSPPSNTLSFFPRFTCGGSGSPPLNVGTSLNTTYSTPKMVARRVSKESVTQPPQAPNPVYRVLNNPPTTQPKSFQSTVNSTVQSTKPIQFGNHPGPSGPLPTFSGYQVKVKYVPPPSNPQMTPNNPVTINQSNVPMKKRHYITMENNTSPSKPVKRDDGPKMTSLYVGASAGFLDQRTERVSGTTSDNDEDRDPLDTNRGQFQHWRKHLITDRGGKEWREYRTKKEEGKKLTVHQYEPTNVTQAKAHNKPKTTFALWDKKHHAISMNTIPSPKSKPSPHLIAPKSSATTTPNSAHGHQVTQVCYTTLQKASKPTIPNTIVVKPQQAATNQKVNAVEMKTSKNDFHLVPALPSTQAVKHMLQSSKPTETNAKMKPISANPVPAFQIHTHASQSSVVVPKQSSNSCPITTHDLNIVQSASIPMTTNEGTVAKHPGLLAPPGAIPYMIPVAYVMYPGGLPTAGLQFTTPKSTNSGGFPDLLPMQTFQVQPADPGLVRVAPKRTATPNRTRSDSTMSSDSTDAPVEKKSKTPQGDTPNMRVITPSPRPSAPSQFVVPSNFMLANGGNTVLGYPMPHYPTTQGVQAMHMGGITNQQNLASLNQLWPLNSGIGLQFASSGVTMPTVVASQQPSLALQVVNNTSNPGPS